MIAGLPDGGIRSFYETNFFVKEKFGRSGSKIPDLDFWFFSSKEKNITSSRNKFGMTTPPLILKMTDFTLTVKSVPLVRIGKQWY